MRGLRDRSRTVIAFMDETVITETPPLRCKYVLKGTDAEVPITGAKGRRILFGTISLNGGGLILNHTENWAAFDFQEHLRLIRSNWRGWNIVLFLDRDSSHTAEESELFADDLDIELRSLPVACPKLNPMDHLWRHVKGAPLANAPKSLDYRVEFAYNYLQDMGAYDWMSKAGLFSDEFWLKEFVTVP
jgi:hypothetical protein